MAFISGHLNITEQEFNKYYREHVDMAITCGHDIIIGDAKGADLLAQRCCSSIQKRNYLSGIIPEFTSPRNNTGSWKTVGGFKTDDERDEAMTLASTYDIAWLRDPNRNSGTRRNIERRKKYIK